MNCDQIFDVLTSGPFPTGRANDAEVESHLHSCHDCRQLAEALRPAVELIHESLPTEEVGALPSYLGAARDGDTSLSLSVMTMIDEEADRAAPAAQPRRTQPRAKVNRWLVVAASLSIVFVGIVAVRQHFWGQTAADSHSAGTPTADQQPDELGRQYLLAMNLPTVCFHVDEPRAEGNPAAISMRLHHLCCTHCHNSASTDRPELTNVAFVQRSCKACHQL